MLMRSSLARFRDQDTSLVLKSLAPTKTRSPSELTLLQVKKEKNKHKHVNTKCKKQSRGRTLNITHEWMRTRDEEESKKRTRCWSYLHVKVHPLEARRVHAPELIAPLAAVRAAVAILAAAAVAGGAYAGAVATCCERSGRVEKGVEPHGAAAVAAQHAPPVGRQGH